MFLFKNNMEIKNINNSLNFQSGSALTREGRKIAEILRQYKKNPSQKLKEELIDVFTPQIEEIARRYEGVSKPDFMQNLYLALLENLENLDSKFHPSADLRNKIKRIKPQEDDFITMGHKSIETLTRKEKAAAVIKEETDLLEEAAELAKFSPYLTPRMKDIFLRSIEGESLEYIGGKFHISAERVKQIVAQCADRLHVSFKKGKQIKMKQAFHKEDYLA